MIVALAIVGLLVVGGGVTGIILATGGKKKHDSHPSIQPTVKVSPSPNQSDGPATPDFPTGDLTDRPTDIPTGSGSSASGTGTDSGDQHEVAQTAETVVHALGNGQPSVFCDLVDSADLARLEKEKHLSQCSDVELSSSADRAMYRDFAVTDPSAIDISGDIADIPASAIAPSDFGGLELRKDTTGTWKYRFYTS